MTGGREDVTLRGQRWEYGLQDFVSSSAICFSRNMSSNSSSIWALFSSWRSSRGKSFQTCSHEQLRHEIPWVFLLWPQSDKKPSLCSRKHFEWLWKEACAWISHTLRSIVCICQELNSAVGSNPSDDNPCQPFCYRILTPTVFRKQFGLFFSACSYTFHFFRNLHHCPVHCLYLFSEISNHGIQILKRRLF